MIMSQLALGNLVHINQNNISLQSVFDSEKRQTKKPKLDHIGLQTYKNITFTVKKVFCKSVKYTPAYYSSYDGNPLALNPLFTELGIDRRHGLVRTALF